jgi:hypothetical protein
VHVCDQFPCGEECLHELSALYKRCLFVMDEVWE